MDGFLGSVSGFVCERGRRGKQTFASLRSSAQNLRNSTPDITALGDVGAEAEIEHKLVHDRCNIFCCEIAGEGWCGGKCVAWEGGYDEVVGECGWGVFLFHEGEDGEEFEEITFWSLTGGG